MALAPDFVKYGQAYMHLPATVGVGTQDTTVTATLQSGGSDATSWPSAHVGAGTHDVAMSWATDTGTGTGRTGSYGLAVVEDNTDTSGNLTISDVVDFVIPVGNEIGSPPGSGAVSVNPSHSETVQITIPTTGVYRLVIVATSDYESLQNGQLLDDGATSPQWWYDSDGNEFASTLGETTGPPPDEIWAGAIGALARLTTYRDDLLEFEPYGTHHYGQVPEIFMVMAPVGSSTFRERWQVRLAVCAGNDGSGPVDTFDRTPSAAGFVTSGTTWRVDTSYPAAATEHFYLVGVNNTLGNVSTPSGQRPGLYSVATVLGLTTSQRSWVAFTDDAGEYGSGMSRVSASLARRDAGFDVGSGIVVDLIESHDDAARVNASRLFRRPHDGNHENPYLRATLSDAFGDPLDSTAVTARVLRTGTSTQEDSQALTTDGSGVIEWDYAIADGDDAYNSTLTGAAASISIAEVDVFGANPFGFIDGNTDYRGPYAAAGKDVEIVGREFGTSEPDVTEPLVFGVSSEASVPNLWTGDAGQANADGNDAPTGTVSRFKNLGTGSPRVKPSSEIDEGNAELVDAAREVFRDVAGRTVETPSRVGVRYAAYNVTLSQDELTETDGSNPQDLQGTLGYPTAFVTVAPPGDPSVVQYAWAFSTNGSTLSTFQQTTDAAAGFGSDSGGLFGFITQSINFTAVDPNLTFAVGVSEGVTHPGATINITAEMRRILATNVRVEVEPDAPLHIYIDRRDPVTGALTTVVDTAMTLRAGSSTEHEFVFAPGEAASYSVTITGFINGSRPPDGGDLPISTATRDPYTILIADVGHADSDANDRHLSNGDPLEVAVYAKNTRDGDPDLLTLDADPAPAVSLERIRDGGVQRLSLAGVWEPATDGQLVAHPLTLSGSVWVKTFATDDDWSDVIVNAFAQYQGIQYDAVAGREFVGSANPHSGYGIDPLALALNGQLSQR